MRQHAMYFRKCKYDHAYRCPPLPYYVSFAEKFRHGSEDQNTFARDELGLEFVSRYTAISQKNGQKVQQKQKRGDPHYQTF